jgi:hypothetical protein
MEGLAELIAHLSLVDSDSDARAVIRGPERIEGTQHRALQEQL